MRSNVVDVTVRFHWETEKAIKVSDDGEEESAVWIPKQYVEYDESVEPDDTTVITLRESIAKEKGLI